MPPDDEKKSDAPEEASSLTSPSPAAALLSHDVAAISLSLRVPPFWRDQPILWFCSFEAATAELKRSQAQLAQMVIAQLEKQDIQNISDLIYSPPEENYYTAIKNRLISVYEESNSAQTKKLLSQVELGEQKPSQLLRRMKTLNKEKFPETTIQMMWLDHLPPHVRSVLTVSEAFKIKTTLEDLALLADKMLEHTPTSASHQIAAVSTPAVLPPSLPTPPSTSALDAQYLIGEIRRLSLEVAELRSRPRENCNQRYSRSHRRFPSRPRNQSQDRSPRSRRSSPMPYCHYHRRFGMDAQKCAQPCSFKPIPATPSTAEN
ncbi:uncharacterized protein LOC134799678 [Cydia splendana]|uniref:uncharacterized protein LOC134799678 n=1 Tax=Cydia splendana TaxID=1100963 RepID=UPI00300CDD1D